MDENLDNKKELKDKVVYFYKENKLKVFSFISILLIIFIAFFLIKINQQKQNILISEKYVQAGLYLASKENEKSKIIYEEIILSKNQFYSILALNNILEKKLETDKNKILNYFNILENGIKNKEQKDLVAIKKALYLIKITDFKKGNEILKSLIDSNSKFKSLAEEILAK